jgi:hypothetical protein
VLAFAKSQVDYILGTNPTDTSYLVGYSAAYPRRVHHRTTSSVSFRRDRDFIGCLEEERKGKPVISPTFSLETSENFAAANSMFFQCCTTKCAYIK